MAYRVVMIESEVESQIILKMLNDSMGIKSKWHTIPKKPELEFMIS